MNKTKFAKAAKEAALNLVWPESAFVAGAKWALQYISEQQSDSTAKG